jgi:hypothetical protein
MSDALPDGTRHVHVGPGEQWPARLPTPALPPQPPLPPPPPPPPLPPVYPAGPAAPLRDVFGLLGGAVSQLAASGTDEQLASAGEVLDRARRDLYRILAGDAGATGTGTVGGTP